MDKDFARVWRAWWTLWGLYTSMAVYARPGDDLLSVTLYATDELVRLSIVFGPICAIMWLCLKKPPLWWRNGERWL